jgi:hypothetical protein
MDAAHPSNGYGLVDAACVTQHEWFTALRAAGFTRLEALYIVTRPSVEMARQQWLAEHPSNCGDL